MTLADIKNYIFRRTKTTATAFLAADMVIAINNALERTESIIRMWNSTYDATRYTTSDLSTGTAVPKFKSTFHELLGLWPSYQYAIENGMPSANGFADEIKLKEEELKRWYGMRNYQIFTVTIASPGIFTLDKHGFRSGDRIIFETTGALPTGLSAETWYYVLSTGLTDRLFEVSATKDGTAINTSGSQSGTHYVGLERQQRARIAYEDTR